MPENGGAATTGKVSMSKASNRMKSPPSVAQDGMTFMQALNKAENHSEAIKRHKSQVGSRTIDFNISVAAKEAKSRSHVSEIREERICGATFPTTMLGISPTTHGIKKGNSSNPLQQNFSPDLNAAESARHLITQPVMNAQQVQLRAQILVYGYLIQGSLPEEALMIAAFADICGAARQDKNKDAVDGGKVFWEKAWCTAAERMKGRLPLNTPSREPAGSIEASILATSSSLPMITAEGERLRRLMASNSAGLGSCTADTRNLSVSKSLETPGFKGHSSQAMQNSTSMSGRFGNKYNPLPSNRPVSASPSTWFPPSPVSETLQASQVHRPPQVDPHQLLSRPFSSPQHGAHVSGSARWLSPSPFPASWNPPVQVAGFDPAVPSAPLQPSACIKVIQEPADSRMIMKSSQAPFAPSMPVVPSFAQTVVGSSPIIENTAADIRAVQKRNVGSARQITSESRSRKRKKSQTETTNKPVDVLVTRSLLIPCPEPIPAAVSAAPSLPLWSIAAGPTIASTSSGSGVPLSSVPESLAKAMATTHGQAPILEAHIPASQKNGAPNSLLISEVNASMPSLQPTASAQQHQGRPILSENMTSQELNVSMVSQDKIVATSEHQVRPIVPENMMSYLKQVELSAEVASSKAASAILHGQSFWSQLQSQKRSVMDSDTEAQVASSVVAMEAAASVAKAAAAAARVAYEAALQEKLLGEEAWEASKEINGIRCSGASVGKDGAKNAQSLNVSGETVDGIENKIFTTMLMPSSCKCMIAVAKEEAKKRLEAASAARIRAHNLDLVVKAAELATESVSQAGAIVAMGNSVPFTLDMLPDADPEGIHRLKILDKLSHNFEKENVNQKGREGESPWRNQNLVKELKRSEWDASPEAGVAKKSCVQEVEADGNLMVEPETTAMLDLSSNDRHSQGNAQCLTEIRKDKRNADGTQLTGIAAQSGIHQNEELVASKQNLAPSADGEMSRTFASEITTGSVVEVLSHEVGFRGVWFSAKVLSVEGGKALVLYDDRHFGNDSGQLKEWIDLKEQCGFVPRLRLAHPITKIKSKGTKKWRAATRGNCVSSVGDHVDAWIQNGWWEGEVIWKCEEDETNVKVFFPGEGGTAFIKSWNLRPSLIWEDDHWVLWSGSMMESNRSQEMIISPQKSATFLAKSQKVDKEHMKRSNKVDEQHDNSSKKGKGKGSESISSESERSKGQDTTTMSSMKESQPTGALKNTKDVGDTMLDRRDKEMPTNEGPGVLIGALKPTKKRKILEVSKRNASKVIHGSPEGKTKEKNIEHKVSASNSQMRPDGVNKVDDGKGKKKLVPKQSQENVRREEYSIERTLSENTSVKKNKGMHFSDSGMGSRRETSGQGAIASGPTSSKTAETKFDEIEMLSDVHQLHVHSLNVSVLTSIPKETGSQKQPVLSKCGPSSAALEQVTKDMQILHSTEIDDRETDGHKSEIEVVEPRRSIRRIQPTSKLLEGLQSTPKLVKNGSSLLQEKGSRVPLETFISAVKGVLS